MLYNFNISEFKLIDIILQIIIIQEKSIDVLHIFITFLKTGSFSNSSKPTSSITYNAMLVSKSNEVKLIILFLHYS